jgi:5,6-dimethylbenzimidazole synthase
VNYEALLEIVQNTRSVRRFKPDQIPDDYIDKILEVARLAPSGFNQQPWEFVVVKNADLRKKISDSFNVYWNQSREMETTREPWQQVWNPESVGTDYDYSLAPVYILLFGDKRTQTGLPMGVRYDEHRLNSIYISSLANAFLYMHMAASTLGLASQWLSTVSTPYVHCMVKQWLGITAALDIYDMMAFGYPAVKPRPKLLREKEKMVHYDYCGPEAFRTDEEVKDFIRNARTWTIASHNRKPDK